MTSHRIADSLARLRSEFLAMPKLSLTPGEIARILDVDPPTARVLLHTLEKSHFLRRTRDGRFVRVAPPAELHDCAVCGQARANGTLLKVANTLELEAMWVCGDCQHKLTRQLDDEGALGG